MFFIFQNNGFAMIELLDVLASANLVNKVADEPDSNLTQTQMAAKLVVKLASEITGKNGNKTVGWHRHMFRPIYFECVNI